MRDVEVRPDVDLEELLDNEIPCAGIRARELHRTCGRAAVVRWTNPHQCEAEMGDVALQFKCLDCWMALYQLVATNQARYGQVRCRLCKRVFSDVLSLTDYRPF